MLPPLDPWLDATMPRHLLVQVPALLAIGALAFWMIPRALDTAIIRNDADQALWVMVWVGAGAHLARAASPGQGAGYGRRPASAPPSDRAGLDTPGEAPHSSGRAIGIPVHSGA
jgi:hypothetical protein